MPREGGSRQLVGIEKAVGDRPAAQPTTSPRAQRPREVRVGLEEVGSRAGSGPGIGVEQRREEREIVLGLVDGVLRRRWRRPPEPRPGRALRAAGERIEGWKAA